MSERKRRGNGPGDGGAGDASLAEEIAVLRGLLQRVGSMADDAEGRSLSEMLRLLDVYSLSSGRLGALLKVQHLLESGQSQEEVQKAMEAILDSLSRPGEK